MSEHGEPPLDRTDRDGAAGKGDMLGRINAGADDRLGIDERYRPAFAPQSDGASNVDSVANLPRTKGA